MKLFAIFAALLLCASCATELEPKRTLVEQPQIEADIREAVFRHQFGNKLGDDVSAIFLTVGKGGIPSGDFIKRFAGHHPPVKPVSRCWPSMRRGVIDKSTGRRGVMLSVGQIDWVADREVRVTGGYYFGGLGASTFVYTVKQRDGKWEVRGRKLVGVS